jgi:hypothetical protein
VWGPRRSEYLSPEVGLRHFVKVNNGTYMVHQVKLQWIKEKPVRKLDSLFIPTTHHKLFPPIFHWAIPLPCDAVHKYAQRIRDMPETSNHFHSHVLQVLEIEDLLKSMGSRPPTREIEEALGHDDDDDKSLALKAGATRWDTDVAAAVLLYIEDKIRLPYGGMRVKRTVYRRGGLILSFYCNYDEAKLWMSEDTIISILQELGVQNAEPLWWSSAILPWTKIPKAA